MKNTASVWLCLTHQEKKSITKLTLFLKVAEIAAIEVISRAKKAVAKATIEAENASEKAKIEAQKIKDEAIRDAKWAAAKVIY